MGVADGGGLGGILACPPPHPPPQRQGGAIPASPLPSRIPPPMPRRLLLPLLLCLLASPSRAADPTYWGEVRQALRKNCTVCHNKRNLAEPEVSGGLTLDTYAAALKWKEKALVVP